MKGVIGTYWNLYKFVLNKLHNKHFKFRKFNSFLS